MTTVAFITSDGPRGPNVMSAEWTFNVSYEPFLVSVHIAPDTATHENITATKEFGVNLVADDQVRAMGFAGHFSKVDTDKLTSELFETYPATKVQAPLIRGALMNAECRLVQQVTMGDHTAFVGEVVAFQLDSTKSPVVLHRGPRRVGPRIERAPGIAMAATPGEVPAGTTIAVDGEVSGRPAPQTVVAVVLQSSDGREVARIEAKSGSRYFHADLRIPEHVPRGRYTLVARSHDAEGRARVTVT